MALASPTVLPGPADQDFKHDDPTESRTKRLWSLAVSEPSKKYPLLRFASFLSILGLEIPVDVLFQYKQLRDAIATQVREARDLRKANWAPINNGRCD
jgi:hypothetical protein